MAPLRLSRILWHVRAWRERRQALGEFAQMQKESAPFENQITDDILELAGNALIRQDRAEAERLWNKASVSNPARVSSSPAALHIVLELGRFEEAATLMTAGMKASRGAPYYLEGLAKIAQAQRNYPEAVMRWERFRRKSPLKPAGYYNPAACLRELGRADEAEALLHRGLRKLPGDFNLRVEHARLAEYRQDWSAATSRWELVYRKYSNCQGGLGTVRGLRESGKLDEAEALLRELRWRWPTDPHPAIQLARLAQAQGDTNEALRRWALVRERFPLILHGHIDGTKALLAAGRVNEAEAILVDAISRFKHEVAPTLEYARIAHSRRDWSEANRRWQAMRERFPERSEGYELGAQALAALGLADEAKQLRETWKARQPAHG